MQQSGIPFAEDEEVKWCFKRHWENLMSIVRRQRELILYCIIGCSGVALDYISFGILTSYTGFHYQVVNAVSVSIGVCNNFFWNAHVNFKVKNCIFFRFLSFYCVGMLGLALSAVLLYFLIEVMLLNVLVAKFCIIFVVTIAQFTLNKLVTFRKRDGR